MGELPAGWRRPPSGRLAALLLVFVVVLPAAADEEAELRLTEKRLREVQARLRKARESRAKAQEMRQAVAAAAGANGTRYDAVAAMARREDQKRRQKVPEGWARLEGDCPGHNLEQMKGVSAADCVTACESRAPECQGVSFVQSPVEAPDSTFCWLKGVGRCKNVVKSGWMFYTRDREALAPKSEEDSERTHAPPPASAAKPAAAAAPVAAQREEPGEE
eukprot:TRINITY_DN8373_c0_g1_i1.p1 TRINITY_DN8373_c0_g1~~TRINITY_DN8373_c0_g1_i1.p1  ORF type:complete len:219 (+),score=51.60 TRINITY_DN8373_c0_g1_i1:61-717(+)